MNQRTRDALDGKRPITCQVCGCVHVWIEGDPWPPKGWVVGHETMCSADCMRTLYEGMAIAWLFPADATPEEERALRKHENELLSRTSRMNPAVAGVSAGKIFRDRELREEARGR